MPGSYARAPRAYSLVSESRYCPTNRVALAGAPFTFVAVRLAPKGSYAYVHCFAPEELVMLRMLPSRSAWKK